MFGLVLLVSALFTLALLVLLWAGRLRQESGVPQGKIAASDMYGGLPGTPGKPLFSERFGLSGTPDYVVATREGPVPVEVKPGRGETKPHESHLLQVLAYCLLLEERDGKPPPYGLLRYSSETFRVDYNSETRAYLIEVLDEMRQAAEQREVHRNHQVAARCKACTYRDVCEEALG